MQLKADSDCRCQSVEVNDSPSGGTIVISASVGLGGVNRPPDVRTVQELLNDVRPDRGGPVPLLVVDGLCGPLTRAAIRKFQMSMKLPVQDSRVDPGGPTLQALYSERLNKSANPDRKIREAQRLATAIASSQDSQRAVTCAIQLVEAAVAYKLSGTGFATTPHAFDFVSKHFKFGGVSESRTIDDLMFIKTIYYRMRTVLRNYTGITGTIIFGGTMHAIDPIPGKTPPLWKAYVPGEDSETLKSTRIYWTDHIDGHPKDRYTYLTLHELAHFVDGADPSLQIVDNGYLALGTVFALNHDKRMHNADNYSMMAFDRTFGRARLSAIYPTMAMMKD